MQELQQKFIPPPLAKWSGLDVTLTDSAMRALLRDKCELQPLGTGDVEWVLRDGGRIATEDELCNVIGPDAVCCLEAMRAGLVRLDALGLRQYEELTKVCALCRRYLFSSATFQPPP